MADLQISALPPLAGGLLQGTDPFAVADLSASETKKISAVDLATGLAGLFPTGSIPTSAINLTLSPGSITTTLLADRAVTAAKLNDRSTAAVAAGLPATGAFIGQLGFDTASGTLRIWDGGTWQALKAAGSINNFVSDSAGTVTTNVVIAGDTATLTSELAATTAARQFFAGPTTGGGAATARQIVGADLPAATRTEQGAVQVGGGLAVTGGVVAVDNTVVPGAPAVYGVVEYNAFGLVTSGRAITSADLPVAQPGRKGAIAPSTEFTVTATGDLHHTNSVTAGSATKVTFDARGHITGGSTLSPADIPDLDATKLSSGTLDAARIGNASITRQMLADYSISFIQEAAPSNSGVHAGALWLQESTGALRMWNSNSWFPIGFGRLSAENLRYCGTFNAATGAVSGLTQFGTAEGLTIGGQIPAASDKHAGAYLVVTTPGNGTPVAAGVTFDNGDWIVCNGATGGWVRVDTLNSGAGGGGGATHLNDLLDVTINAGVAPDDLLQYSASGQWLNVSELDCGNY